MNARIAVLVPSFVGLSLLVAAGLSAQTPIFDHLKCYRIKDRLPAGVSTADLNPEQAPPFSAEPGCRIKRPAKLFCIDVEKTNVQPPPPLAVGGGTARDYLCYAVRCPKPAAGYPQIVVEDQFGVRAIDVKPPRYLCAPANKVVPQPTPTPRPCNDLGGGQCSDTCPQGMECLYVPAGTVPGVDQGCNCITSEYRCENIPSLSVCSTAGGLCPTAAVQCVPPGATSPCACQ